MFISHFHHTEFERKMTFLCVNDMFVGGWVGPPTPPPGVLALCIPRREGVFCFSAQSAEEILEAQIDTQLIPQSPHPP